MKNEKERTKNFLKYLLFALCQTLKTFIGDKIVCFFFHFFVCLGDRSTFWLLLCAYLVVVSIVIHLGIMVFWFLR